MTTDEYIEQIATDTGQDRDTVADHVSKGHVYVVEAPEFGGDGTGEWVNAADTKIVVIGIGSSGYGAWGSGKTEKAARVVFRSNGGVIANGITTVTFPFGVHFGGVDNFGRYRWYGPEAPTSKATPPR